MDEIPGGNRSDALARRAAARRRGRKGRGSAPWIWGVALLTVVAACGWLAWRFGLVDGRALKTPRLFEAAPPSSKEVTLYFGDPRWTRLAAETRRVPAQPDSLQLVRTLVDALAEGPRTEAAPVLPKGAKLRGAYLGQDGLALIDFEPEMSSYDPGGSPGELLAVFALVHTITENVPGIRSVQVLIGGEERETLAGHVKISEPLSPDIAWNRRD